ncbi:MAG: Holliday junction branch migration DNA helicase RuvB [Candidatus Abawacabacteria bacterium]|nr:Holliday junction branch migration DNA helicase RuvB [Candidatus Abawacabacteria bacterium]
MRKKTAAKQLQNDAVAPEESWELTLRPQYLQEYIGQSAIKENLSVFIQASKKRKEALDHLLLFGPPGLGKTTLAMVIARELDVDIVTSAGTALQKPSDIISLLSTIKPYSVIFIDEIHRLKLPLEEMLYTAMEDFRLDIMVGKGQASEAVSFPLPPFTLIGATTRNGDLSAPLRHRFGETFRLQFYTIPELTQIVQRTASLLQITIVPEAAKVLAQSARGTPRIANRLLKRVRDFANMADRSDIDLTFVSSCLSKLGINAQGLDHNDVMLLTVMIEKFYGRPIGVKTLASACHETEETILNVYEPYLIQEAFIERTPQGRKPTAKAYELLGLPFPTENEAAK